MLNTFTLANGIHVATYRMDQVKSLHLGISVKGGSLVESKKASGIAHFMEHMLVQGSPTYPTAEALSNYVESLAGRYGASTSQLIVHFSISVPFSHVKDAVEIASEAFFQPLFPEVAIEKERQAVLNEMKQDMDSTWYKFNEFYRKERYKKTSPLQLRTIGIENVILSATREDLLTYWHDYFTPENTYLFIGGNFKEEPLRELLHTYFERYPKQHTFTGFPKLSKNDLSFRHVAIRHDKKLQVNYLNLSFPGLSMEASVKDVIKQNIALDILGRFRSSRLFKLLRYQKGLVYGVSSSDVRYPGMGYVYAESEVSSEHLDEVLTLTVQALHEFLKHGPTEEEVTFTKNYLTNQWLMAFDSPGTIGDWVEGGLLWREKIRLPEEYIELVKDVTAKDILAIMEKYWDLGKLTLILQGPLLDTEENKKKYAAMLDVLK